MTITRPPRTRPGIRLGACLAGLALVAALAPATAASAATTHTPRTTAARAAACAAADITVRRGRLEGAAGSRFQTVRVTNTGAHACALPGWTRYRFVHRGQAIGFRSTRNPGQAPGQPPVVIPAGGTARSTLSWVDPGPVPAGQCHARLATGSRVHLAGITAPYRIHLHAMVCTTERYRPQGTRLRVG